MAPGSALVRVTRESYRAIPRRFRPIHLLLRLPAPCPGLGHRERQQADMERSDVRPQESHLLPARSDDRLAISECNFQAEASGYRPRDVCYTRRDVRTEESAPPGRPADQHHP